MNADDVPWALLGDRIAALVNAWEDLHGLQKAELIKIAPEVYFATARVVRTCQVTE